MIPSIQTSTLTADQALTQASELENHFSVFYSEGLLLKPQEFVAHVYQLYQSQQCQHLHHLGQLVTDTYLQKGGLANATQTKLDSISDKLSSATTKLEKIDAHLPTAFKLCAINKTYDGVFNSGRSGGNESYSYENTEYAPINSRSNVSNPTPKTSKSTSNAEVMALQDEAVKISLGFDQFKALQRIENPKQKFEELLTFYTSLKSYIQGTKFITQSNQTEAHILAEHAEKEMEQLIAGQAELEKPSINPTPSSGVSKGTLETLKKAIQAVVNSTTAEQVMEKNKNMKTIFLNLSADEKVQFFKALSNVLINTKVRNTELPPHLQKLDISSWPGSPAYKIKALENVISSLKPEAPSEEVKHKESETMREKLEKAKAPLQAIRPTVSSSSVSSINKASPSCIEKLIALHNTTSLLTDDSSMQNLFEAITKLTELGWEGHYFHIYCIAKNEPDGEPLPTDVNYGEKAMCGQYPITNSVRLRALQRSIIEFALEELKKAATENIQGNTVALIMGLLEKTEMDPKDLPNGKNMAHILFGNLFNLQCKARETNSSLANPSDSKFKPDFGRCALDRPNDEVSLDVKIEAIQRLYEELKKAWKI
jgi:hypothetical protein